ncbi:MAG: hypothetical protein R3C59_13390 [Planctomycetaceae bacterium]
MAEMTPEQRRAFADHCVAEARRIWGHNERLSSDSAAVRLDPASCMAWLDAQMSCPNGGCLTPGFPGRTAPTVFPFFRRRLVWWPTGISERRRIAVVSSRLSQRKDLHRPWFDALRTLTLRCDRERECFCVAEGTAACDAVQRAAILFDVPVLKLIVDGRQTSETNVLAEWLCSAMAMSHASGTSQQMVAVVSPEFVADDAASEPIFTPKPLRIPPADSALIAAADRVVAISCRANGNIESLLHSRLSAGDKASVLVLDDVNCSPPAVLQFLKDAGAVPWILYGQPTDDQRQGLKLADDSSAADPSSDLAVARGRVADSVLTAPQDWLCHWTRPASGPWPGQSQDDFLDELILGCGSADRSAIACLLRMLTEASVVATATRRNEPATVSLTAVPLREFRARRVFRTHRRRYDFEPWGVAIRKASLVDLGARAVRYLESGDVADPETPEFTQQRWDAQGRIDWSMEQEWRIAGDIDFRSLETQDVCFFVNEASEAELIRRSGHWSVVVVPEAANA